VGGEGFSWGGGVEKSTQLQVYFRGYGEGSVVGGQQLLFKWRRMSGKGGGMVLCKTQTPINPKGKYCNGGTKKKKKKKKIIWGERKLFQPSSPSESSRKTQITQLRPINSRMERRLLSTTRSKERIMNLKGI